MDIVTHSGKSVPVPRDALAQWLRELPRCAVLRNEEDLFGNLERGGDVDLLVDDLDFAERTLIRLLGFPVRMIRSSYATGYSYDWGHIDLLPTLEWRGACFLPTRVVLESRRLSPRGRPVPRISHEAVISWMTNLLFGGFFKERYAADIRKAVETDGDTLRQTLIDVAGSRMGCRLWQTAVTGHPEISAEWTRSLRRAVWWRACFRSPPRTLQRFLAFVIGELRLRFDPPVPWIAILGSSHEKSALANAVVHRFASCPYVTVKPFPWRPRSRARMQGSAPVTDMQGKGRRLGGSRVNVLVLAMDWLANYWTRMVHLRAKGYIPASDCTYLELVAAPGRYAYGTGSPFARALWWLLPKPDLVFVLDGVPGEDRAVIQERSDVHVLNGHLPLSGLVDEVQRAIRRWMVDRSAVSLGRAHAQTTPTPSDESSTAAPALLGRRDGAR